MSIEVVLLLREQYAILYDQWLEVYPNRPINMSEFDHNIRMRSISTEMSKLYNLHEIEMNKWFGKYNLKPMREWDASIYKDHFNFSFRTYDATRLWVQFDINGEFSSAILEDYFYKHIPLEKEHQQLIEIIADNVMDAYKLFASLGTVNYF